MYTSLNVLRTCWVMYIFHYNYKWIIDLCRSFCCLVIYLIFRGLRSICKYVTLRVILVNNPFSHYFAFYFVWFIPHQTYQTNQWNWHLKVNCYPEKWQFCSYHTNTECHNLKKISKQHRCFLLLTIHHCQCPRGIKPPDSRY